MAWCYLLIAGVLEVLWVFTMEHFNGFIHFKYSMITIVTMIASFGTPSGAALALWARSCWVSQRWANVSGLLLMQLSSGE